MTTGDFLLGAGYAGAILTIGLALFSVVIFRDMRGRHFAAAAIAPFVIGVLVTSLIAAVLITLHTVLGWRLGLQVYGVFPTSLFVIVPAIWFARRVWTRR